MKKIKIILFFAFVVSKIYSHETNKSMNADVIERDDLYEVTNEALSKPRGWPSIAYAVKLNRTDVVKILLDLGEDVNASTPLAPLWYTSNYDHYAHCLGNVLEGYTPLELAIYYRNVEMVKILTTYREDNRATPEIFHNRYTLLSTTTGSPLQDVWDYYGDCKVETEWSKPIKTTPFLESLKTNNEELIKAVMQSYTNLDAFLLLKDSLIQMQSSSLMHAWIEHHDFLNLKTSLTLPP